MSFLDLPTPMPTSELQRLPSTVHLNPYCRFDLNVVRLHEGLDLYHWRGRFEKAFELQLMEDTHRLFFNFPLARESHYLFHDPRGAVGWLREDGGSIIYGPGVLGRTRHEGDLHSLTLAFRLDFFFDCVGHMDPDLRAALARGMVWETGYGTRALQLATHSLAASFSAPHHEDSAFPHLRLKLLAQSLMVIAVLLEERTLRIPAAARQNPPEILTRLLQAREVLLEDLGSPPDLAALAKRFDLSPAALNAGFKRTFGQTARALHQRERMREARRMLSGEASASVMEVAVRMGYSNASHFAAAFRKQFGVTPRHARSGDDLMLDA
jgi:AraC family transcriptional regulator